MYGTTSKFLFLPSSNQAAFTTAKREENSRDRAKYGTPVLSHLGQCGPTTCMYTTTLGVIYRIFDNPSG